MIEIRWHGRGGQGAKTAALLLADVAFTKGMYVQGFPEYGPERMGAPITAYNRLDAQPIRIHSNIYDPDIVVVVDESLVGPADVTAGLKEGGALIINTSHSPEEIRSLWYEKPMAPACKLFNPAFDVTDHRLISGIITEKGIARPPYTQSLKKLFE